MKERSACGIAFATAIWLVGCVGSLGGTDPNADGGLQLALDGSDALLDGAPLERDASVDGAGWPPSDAGRPPSDAGRPSSDAGSDPEPPRIDAGPTDPCVGVSCGTGASCVGGSCRCDPGFVDMSGTCVAPLPGDPAGRTQAEVCDAWRMGRVENGSPSWVPGSAPCDPGAMAPDAIDDVLRRVNLYRWLAGLGPVGHDGSRHRELMDCAHMMSVNNSLDHYPPTSWTCYTAGGASAAGRSNLALGYHSPASAIDGYMVDRGTPSLGHRRWILSGRLSAVEIGFSAASRPGQCLGVFSWGGSTDRPWTAYPNQGFAPIETASHTWSFHANSISLRGAEVEVVRLSDGATLPVAAYMTGLSGPPPSIGFNPQGWRPSAGEIYRVTIFNTSAGDITYDVALVSC